MGWGLERDMGGEKGAEGVPRSGQVHRSQACGHRSQKDPGRTFSLTELGEKAHIATLCARQDRPG